DDNGACGAARHAFRLTLSPVDERAGVLMGTAKRFKAPVIVMWRPLIQLRCRVWGTNGQNTPVTLWARLSTVCSSKALKYFGLKLHSVVSLIWVVMGFLLTGASHYDNQAVVELLNSFSHHLKRLLGDGAYNDAALQNFPEQYRSVELLAPVKLNQQPVRSKQAQQQLNRLRLICETVNAQLQELCFVLCILLLV
ncbi:MAG TPA: transposase, partial [Ktedonobacteraceae bacterium]